MWQCNFPQMERKDVLDDIRLLFLILLLNVNATTDMLLQSKNMIECLAGGIGLVIIVNTGLKDYGRISE